MTANQPIRSCIIPILLAILCATSAMGATSATADHGGIDLDLYQRLLETHTRAVPDKVGTRVDYRGIMNSKDWARLVAQVHDARPSRMTPAERMAFWINAYNILTVDLIRKHYPIEGIKQIGSFFSPVWDLEVATIEGRPLSLGAIEHEILRKTGEPRIHAAIVCASVSCPPLARTPFRAEQLDADLSAAMRAFLANDEKGAAIDRGRATLRLSKIFDWFGSDFETQGGVPAAITPYLGSEDASWVRANAKRLKIRYFDYDWSLNGLD